MQRNLEIGSKVNNWTVVSEPFKENGRDHFVLKCTCDKEYIFGKHYINRNGFSKSCRSCSGKLRWKDKKTYFDGFKVQNLTVLKCEGLQKGNTIYKVQCDCGHIYRTGHTTLTRKCKGEGLSYCNNCFNTNLKKPKRNTMLTNNLSLTYFKVIERNAKLRGFEFDLTPEYLEELWNNQNGKCAYTQRELLMNTKFNNKEDRVKHTCSLDRINSDKGYVKDNVQWVTKRVNTMKNNMTNSDFLQLCREIANNHANIEPSTTRSCSEGAETNGFIKRDE